MKFATDGDLHPEKGGSEKKSTQKKFQEEMKDVFPIDRDIMKQSSEEMQSPFNFNPSPDEKTPRSKYLRDKAIPPSSRK